MAIRTTVGRNVESNVEGVAVASGARSRLHLDLVARRKEGVEAGYQLWSAPEQGRDARYNTRGVDTVGAQDYRILQIQRDVLTPTVWDQIKLNS